MSKPTFLNNVADEPETQELMSAFDDVTNSPLTDETKPTTSPESVTANPDSVKEEVSTEQSNKLSSSTPEELGKEAQAEATPNAGDANKPSETGDTTNQDAVKKETPKVEPAKEEKLYAGKYKSVEDLENSYKELESTLGRATATVNAYKTGAIPPQEMQALKESDIGKMLASPLVKVKLPDQDLYTNADGTLKFQEYMRDYTGALIMEFQRSLVMGPLASAQFSILRQALHEEHDSKSKEGQSQRQAEEIEGKLYEAFPKLKSDKVTQDRFIKMVNGEKFTRIQQAKAEKKPVQELAYEDYFNIAKDIIGAYMPPTTQPTEVTETMKATPPMTGFGVNKPKDEMDDIIEGMEKSTKRGILF